MNTLWPLYHREIPGFLQRACVTPPMVRLRDVGMNCGCEYTQFPLFAEIGPYSRFDHSLGAALIVWHFTGEEKQALAVLFHDIATPVFAHVVDFLDGDHLTQSSTERGTAEIVAGSAEIRALLGELGLAAEDVSDYHRYPIADNDSPALSADRLEYTLGNLVNYGFGDLDTVQTFYEDLTVGNNESGTPELVFRTPSIAAAFTKAALRCARVYVADEDRFAMETLAQLLRAALDRGVLIRDDLRKTEPFVIAKLRADAVCAPLWERFCAYAHVLRAETKPDSGFWVRVNAKKRWIDPLAAERGRVSQWDAEAQTQITDFLTLDFSHWLSGA